MKKELIKYLVSAGMYEEAQKVLASDEAQANPSLLDNIAGRIVALDRAVNDMKKAFDKYNRNPQKYAPQLDNMKQDANTIRQVGGVLFTLVEKLAKQ